MRLNYCSLGASLELATYKEVKAPEIVQNISGQYSLSEPAWSCHFGGFHGRWYSIEILVRYRPNEAKKRIVESRYIREKFAVETKMFENNQYTHEKNNDIVAMGT
jgi:hypothetical protein